MTRIGSLTGLAADQIRSLNRLTQLGRAISQNQQRLSTLKRINSAKDDPAGLIKATRLEQELAAAEQAASAVTRASSLVGTADATAGEVLTQLQAARTLVLEAAGGSLSSSEVAANQIEVDTILSSIDDLARVEFSGRRLLDGSSSFRVEGADSSEILDVDILDKTTSDDVTVDVNVTSQATQATDTYSDGALGEDVTLIVTGSEGSTAISLSNGATVDDIADAFNAVTYLTGISAAVDGGDVDLSSVDYGSEASITIEATEGTFDTDAGTTVNGTDAVATINGNPYTADGTSFSVHTSNLSLIAEADPSASGQLSTFTVSGEGLTFVIGASPNATATLGLPNLTTASLGGVEGKLFSIASGGANSLTGGQSATALQIIDDAIADVTRSQAIVGSFQQYTLESSGRVLDSSIENMTSALSDIQDTDLALESALLANNQLLRQTTLEALSISNLQGADVLSLLQTSTTRLF